MTSRLDDEGGQPQRMLDMDWIVHRASATNIDRSRPNVYSIVYSI